MLYLATKIKSGFGLDLTEGDGMAWWLPNKYHYVILIFDIKITSQLKRINIFLGPHIAFHFISPLCFLGCRTQFWWHQKKKKIIAINKMWSKLKTGGIYLTAKSGENLVGRKDVLITFICTEIKSNQVPSVWHELH